MKIFKDKKVIILIIILGVFTIGYFIIVNKISYAFSNDFDLNKYYEKTLEIIEKCAIAYGEENSDLFKEEQTIYIKVQDLIDNNLLVPNDNGYIINPLNANEKLNSNVIKIKNEKGNITVEVDG